MSLPIVWSVAGTDSGGGAGLAADQRAAEACGVHLCPVVAAVTAQNSVAVTQVAPVSVALLEAQLAALADDLPPAAIKTGLLGSADNIRVLARCIDRLRERAPVALVVDPVLRASTGADFADDASMAAYRDELLPRATVLTPNRVEAARLLAHRDACTDDLPAMAEALRRAGPATVCITGGDARDDADLSLDWLASPQAQGWLSLPRVDTPHSHGTGCTFATSLASAIARGFVEADAAVLAKMATTAALRRGQALGAGAGAGAAGAVRADAGFAADASLLPRMSWDAGAPAVWVEASETAAPGLYAIVDGVGALRRVLDAGARTVQLRIKRAAGEPAPREAIARAIGMARHAGALLYINDHWALALELGAAAIHLGQEDVLSLNAAQRTQLRAAQAQGLRLGISSHSLWELCRAASMRPAYVACGPVWPTSTKAMPWQPQGLHNLAWWVRMAPAPVVAIGGVLAPGQAHEAARCGAAGVCIVRGLGDEPEQVWPAFERAWEHGRRAGRHAEGHASEDLRVKDAATWPQPTLRRA